MYRGKALRDRIDDDTRIEQCVAIESDELHIHLIGKSFWHKEVQEVL